MRTSALVLLLCLMQPATATPMIITNGSFTAMLTDDITVYDLPKNYNDTYWNETTPETVREFLLMVPTCDWYTKTTQSCGLRARYLCIEGRKHGIELDAITVEYIIGTTGGHRVPVFSHNKTTYYVANAYYDAIDPRVVDITGLREIIKNEFGIEKFGFCNHKSYNHITTRSKTI